MRLVNADKLKEYFPKGVDWDYPVNTNSEVVEIIDDAPTVDAVEVVRCKDCIHNYYNMIPSGEAEHECAKWIELPITADFYCAWGEREDEVTDGSSDN